MQKHFRSLLLSALILIAPAGPPAQHPTGLRAAVGRPKHTIELIATNSTRLRVDSTRTHADEAERRARRRRILLGTAVGGVVGGVTGGVLAPNALPYTSEARQFQVLIGIGAGAFVGASLGAAIAAF